MTEDNIDPGTMKVAQGLRRWCGHVLIGGLPTPSSFL